MIEGIHISRNMLVDSLIWKENEFEKFTVRSAYTVARSLHGFLIYNMNVREKIWSLLWHAYVDPKVHFFFVEIF